MEERRPRASCSSVLTCSMPAAGGCLPCLVPALPCLQMRRFNLGPVGEADCPVFDGMMEYFQVRCCCFCCLCSCCACCGWVPQESAAASCCCWAALCCPECRRGPAPCPCLSAALRLQIYSGGSVGGAALINDGEADIVMNWSGGMHHAKKGEASGGWGCGLGWLVVCLLE